ncbi:MAG: GNAT family N-acetyltransferase [Thermodesulfobacteriota bacterium]
MAGPYLSTVCLNDGREVCVKWLGPEDREAVVDFVRELDDGDLMFLNQDLKDIPALSQRLERLGGDQLRVLAAFDPDDSHKMAGYAYLLRGEWASAHRAAVECFIQPAYRDLGLGSTLLKEVAAAAKAAGLMLLQAEIHVDKKELITAFKRLGFELKAILEDYRVDRQGRPYDVIILLKRLRYPSAQDFLYKY